MTSREDAEPRLDLTDADLRIQRGRTSATAQLAEQIKALIVKQQLPPGARLPTEKELIEESGLSRITVRAAVGALERQGWVVRRQGLGTFVSEPLDQELSSGVRTITEVLLDRGVTPQIEVMSFGVEPASAYVARTLGEREVLTIRRRYGDGEQPVALVTIHLPTRVLDAAEPLRSAEPATETTYTMWEQRLGTRIAEARHEIHAAGASADVAAALDVDEGAPVLVLDRVSFDHENRPLEVVVFHYRPDRYGFSVTLPRVIANGTVGMTERTERLRS
ncbi:GntR family transcriptional regulator [Amycolatopsis sp. EV170708-02-1]|uniref:GntR family transcriptional regulator n=1 Tax=Amycolatopsis sp. EV170708-02-1 TaxID=2919322 RepID=UPI001F0CA1B0|nr:GntR family transcriptional regulator [Amycolatopsis sp. EV170708-02-1]UMP00042.1 GntR family transcriptional regulator [Amycolatopsis sp. EV170708-02-1]